MNESHATRNLLVHLRGVSGGVVLKHSDRFTAGVPDISVTYSDTTWLEIKYLKHGERLKDFIRRERTGRVQLYTMVRLMKACGRAWYIVYRSNRLEIWNPIGVLEELLGNGEKEFIQIKHFNELNLFKSEGLPMVTTEINPHMYVVELCRMTERAQYVSGDGERISQEIRSDSERSSDDAES